MWMWWANKLRMVGLILKKSEGPGQGRAEKHTQTHMKVIQTLDSDGCVCVLGSFFSPWESNCDSWCDNLSFNISPKKEAESTAEIRPYNSCVPLKDTQQSATSVCPLCVCFTWRRVCVSVWSGATWSWSWHCWSSSVPSGHGSLPRNDCTLHMKTHTQEG